MVATALKRAAIIALISVLCYKFRDDIQNLISSASRREKGSHGETLFTQEKLAKYDGHSSELLYLSLLGRVYDVTSGKKHYEPGASYNFFVGKDASKSFITGQFTDDAKNPDDVMDLTDEDLSGLVKWMDMYNKQYIYKGKMIGLYYDDNGKQTEYLYTVLSRVEAFQEKQSRDMDTKMKYPPCNIEWDASKGSRVWCTKQSGGVERDWIGVPRQYYEPGLSEPRCACVNYGKDDSIDVSLIKEYTNCATSSVSCYL